MNLNNYVSIMDIEFINTTKNNFLDQEIYPRLNQQEKCFIVTANPEILMKAREDAVYKQTIQSADFVIPDGIGVIMASKYMNTPLQERIPGTEVMMDLLAYANEHRLSCYFLGAKDFVNEKVVLEVEKQFPNIEIAGNQHGYTDVDDPTFVEKVVKSNPDLIFVALGLPRQEQWVEKHIDQFNKGIFMGVGGSFDVLAGEVKRAPKAWIKLNLEWLYRLVKQPLRLKRVFKIFEFMARVILKRI
ncbi:N-acetylglucosaminyldiphosphoundecaprenol N-acetyl-beta-D-mannosaminyltransferase [Oceanobacillus limi]|uniref:N-acetylglucosaminyldiphosphoundecaprenol N-acetyl-beta-D-mannosaminyltransferase n=1 Tax=Oceanobacillus limi TaxID=930131 RepID=A0A1I0A4V4_9BACI|nr:WecB/TagA/CpsF family glycosyltransferase [Oceanobacillus limi]SES88706.1 N-acetylglucosaminyldiphosphoundecaprenol N-acetyl-beta-D-mannosaminyltransferase [Oceanobacillus limi]